MTDTTSPAGSRIEFLEMTTQIVAAYVSNNALQAEDVPQLIRLVHSSLESVQVKEVSQEPLKPQMGLGKSERE